MKVYLRTARPLGWACANIVKDDLNTEVVGHHHDAEGWWGIAGEPQDWLDAEPDLVVSVLNSHIFTPEEIAKQPIINLHPAPLPEYRGCNSYAHAIMDEAKEYGVSLHYVDEGIDTGPLIGETRWDINHPWETAKSLHDTAQQYALWLFTKWWPIISGGLPPATVQSQHGAQYFRRDSLLPFYGSDDPVVRRALTFPPFTNGYGPEKGQQ